MPPLPGQKGTGKKGSRDARPSRSRNTTPSIAGGSSVPPADTGETALLDLPIQSLQTQEELVGHYGGSMPTSKELEAIQQRVQRVEKIVENRANTADRGMRLLAQMRKSRNEDIETEKRDSERKRRDDAEEEERGRAKKANKPRKRKEISAIRDEKERPLTHGAHGLAPQDGSNIERSSPIRDPTVRKASHRTSRDDSSSSSLSPVAVATPAANDMDIEKVDPLNEEEDESSSDEHQPRPAPAVPHLQTFGEDPSTFPDPTVYEVQLVTEEMSRARKMEIFSVSYFPEDNLEKLIPGTPPDKDFSNAKPTNQVQANTFATYTEPYFRPFTEEDLSFLRERGDRTSPFIIPRRGKKHYTEVWAEEDGIEAPSQNRDKLPANQARGNIEDLDDAVAETDEVSAGPLLSRLLSLMRPEHRASQSEERPITNGLTNGEANVNGEANGDIGDLSLPLIDTPAPIPPATFMTESSTESWKKATHPRLDYAQTDERLKQELRHLAIFDADTEPDYDGHFDDEIAARLRVLQARLKETTIKNGAKKTVIQDRLKEYMAHQEYTTIHEDLDNQVNTGYAKRTRTMGKNKKAKRPGGAGGGSHYVGANSAMARPAIGDVTKSSMERRKRWRESIGVLFDGESLSVPRMSDPSSSIFKPEVMAEYIKKEKESWDEEVDED